MTGRHRGRRSGRVNDLGKDVVLTLGAACGVLALVWLAYAHLTGATIVVLKTGSMSPAMPQGAAAVALPVDAQDLAVGDVVTVRRDDASPLVTHRVVDVEEVPGAPASRSLTLRGDANDADDLFPYEVDRVLRTSYSLPHAGYVASVLQTPPFLGGIVLMIGLLVLWAFWPARLEDIEAELHSREERDRSRHLTREAA